MQLHGDINEEELKKILNEFTGEIYQLPPVRASVKRALRKRKVYHIKLLEIQDRMVLFRAACQAGTYIRKLCSDMGDTLGTGAHMRELRRVRAGPFHIDENLTTLLELWYAWEQYKGGDESLLRQRTMPVEYMFKLMPKVYIRDSAVDAICHGAALAIPGIVKLDLEIKRDDSIGVFTLKDEVVAIAKAMMSTDEILDNENGIAAQTRRVIMPVGVYPKKWKTHNR